MTATRPGIDHLVHAVHDLAAAREIFSGFGFTLTPEARHPFGTGNSLSQFQGNFLELLAVVEPEKLVPMSEGRFSFGAFNRDFLAEREGLSMLVLTSDDSERDRRLWAERGLQTFEPLHFERQARQPDGSAAKSPSRSPSRSTRPCRRQPSSSASSTTPKPSGSRATRATRTAPRASRA